MAGKKKDPKDNLMPIEEVNASRTREQHSKDSKKAGKASGKARRQRKQFKELFKSILETPLPQDELKAKIDEMGLEKEKKNYNTLLAMTTLNEALKGNMKAIELIRDTIGEKPKDEIEVKDVTPKWFKKKG